MRKEVLESASYQEIVFQSTGITATRIAEGWYRLAIAGRSFRCMVSRTRTRWTHLQLRMREDDVNLSGECQLLQSKYRIKRVSALAGMITLKDELKLTFELVGTKQDG